MCTNTLHSRTSVYTYSLKKASVGKETYASSHLTSASEGGHNNRQ